VAAAGAQGAVMLSLVVAVVAEAARVNGALLLHRHHRATPVELAEVAVPRSVAARAHHLHAVAEGHRRRAPPEHHIEVQLQ